MTDKDRVAEFRQRGESEFGQECDVEAIVDWLTQQFKSVRKEGYDEAMQEMQSSKKSE